MRYIGPVVLSILLAVGGLSATARAAQPLPPPPFGLSEVHTGPEADRRVAWWREARFGMFIHFGVYSVAGRGEWARFSEQIPQREYARLAEHFTPDLKSPEEWVRVARQAGMRYMVLTARHHDGFALFDSHANEFNSARTAAHQDIVREFVDAARAGGMRVGLYYSPLDWRFPGYFFPDLYLESAVAMRDQYHQELEQLASGYGKLDLIWFDGGGEQWLGFGGMEFDGGSWKSRDRAKPYSGAFSWQDDLVIARLRQLQSQILINDRTSAPGDWRTREGADRLGGFDNVQPWELCVTLAGAWGYQPGAQPRSLQELVLLLTNTAARDGNLLLNVGPAPSGHIPTDQVARLQELGRWLKRHGEAIYGTRGGPFLPSAQVESTRVGRTIFLHVLPGADGTAPLRSIVLPAFPAGPKLLRARVQGAAAGLPMHRTQSGGARVVLPESTPASPTIIVELTYDGSVMEVPPGTLSRSD
jgi:alpha-L-fucosidase